MKTHLYVCCFLTFFLTVHGLKGQQIDSVRGDMILIQASYGTGLPAGDLKDRFGLHFELGIGASLLTDNNLYLSTGYNFLFGNKVKENVLESLQTVEGGIIGSDTRFATVFLRERANQLYFNAGYFFSLSSQHRSGLVLAGGAGILTHKIRIVDDFDSVVQLSEPYNRGYDRLSSGLAINQYIGYLYLSRNRMVNFFAGIQLTEGFTKNLRGYNYDQKTRDEGSRLDIFTTIKVGWILPIYLQRQIRYY